MENIHNVDSYRDMKRDFTFIDDIINGIRMSIKNNYLCDVFNLGNNKSEELITLYIL